MNGGQPLIGRHLQHAMTQQWVGRGTAARGMPLRVCGTTPKNANPVPSRKAQLLQQCARIGFTPNSPIMLNDAFLSFDVLENSPWLNKQRHNILLS